jgi:hypothetical protein
MMAICLYYRHSKIIYPDKTNTFFGSKKEKNPLLIRIQIKKKEVLAPSLLHTKRQDRVSNNHSLSIACPYLAL